MAPHNNLLVMKWLFENTKEPNCSIPWQRNKSGGYFAILNEGKPYQVGVAIARVQSRPVAVIVVKFSSSGQGEVCVQEPLRTIFSIRKRYDSEDDKELAEIMNNLLETVRDRLAQKTLHDMETEEKRKQVIFHRLLFGNTQNK